MFSTLTSSTQRNQSNFRPAHHYTPAGRPFYLDTLAPASRLMLAASLPSILVGSGPRLLDLRGMGGGGKEPFATSVWPASSMVRVEFSASVWWVFTLGDILRVGAVGSSLSFDAGAGASGDASLLDVPSRLDTRALGLAETALETCSGLRGYTLEGPAFCSGCAGSWLWRYCPLCCASESDGSCFQNSVVGTELCRLELSGVVLENMCLMHGCGDNDILLRF